ncbi:hypothetical protein CHH28_10085 [Bacterioplanes sanyensis]|uniref:Methyltransferase type 11 domain-containing protein n=1 Tax=Bacterioplanes sanyensis TaxID=1249553 RepID=A0A222FIZ0_9GAMM|nr:methyltransferase domain-containing protein [Bacterioplanes sanyensis]ASP39005.1 hypothetical protein CHH28_10085 [Bacterioplanes sanyensis]
MKYNLDFSFAWSRDQHLMAACKGKSVLHIGACDSPYTERKLKEGLLLHTKLASVTDSLLGIDIDEASINYLSSQGITDVRLFDMNKMGELDFTPDIIILGEAIEHFVNFASVFENIKRIMQPHTRLFISTPNAYFINNFKNSLFGYESNHPEHTTAFTPRTLEYMLNVNGLTVDQRVATFLDRKKERWGRRMKKHSLSKFPFLCETLLYSCQRSA